MNEPLTEQEERDIRRSYRRPTEYQAMSFGAFIIATVGATFIFAVRNPTTFWWGFTTITALVGLAAAGSFSVRFYKQIKRGDELAEAEIRDTNAGALVKESQAAINFATAEKTYSERDVLSAKARQENIQADHMELFKGYKSYGNTERVVTASAEPYDILLEAEFPPQVHPLLEAGEEEQLPQLWDLIKDVERLFIRGEMGSGKTSLLHKIIRKAQSETEAVVVIDLHLSELTDWPCSIVDTPGKADKFLRLLMKRMEYRVQTRGQINHSPICLVIDEMMDMNEQLPELFPKFMKHVSRYGRKAKINIALATQSNRVSETGLKGVGDLIRAYTQVELYYEHGKPGEWSAEYNLGGKRGFRPAIPPEPSEAPLVKGELLEVGTIQNVKIEEPTEPQGEWWEERFPEWAKIVDETDNRSEATRTIYNRSYGGPFGQKLRRKYDEWCSSSSSSSPNIPVTIQNDDENDDDDEKLPTIAPDWIN